MFAYICLGTNDPKRSHVFYDAVLGALGIHRCQTVGEDFGDWAGWGHYERHGAEQLALWLCPPFDGGAAQSGNGIMVALKCAISGMRTRRFPELGPTCGGKPAEP